MIVVQIKDEEGTELSRIEIRHVSEDKDAEFGDYSVRFLVARGKAVGIHQRGVLNFPRKKFNVLALLRQALDSMDEWEFDLDQADISADMAGRQHPTLSEIQTWFG